MENDRRPEASALPIVALTGGMGTGKSYVCRLLAERGIAVYDCDDAAKRLMRESESLRRELIRLAGPAVYSGAQLQKAELARFLLASDANREAINGVVHPAVARDFLQSGYTWLESAILFDSGFHRRVHFDAIVCVSAPLEVRVKRIMERDGLTRGRALQWIGQQWPQEKVRAGSDYEIVNDGSRELYPQIDGIISKLYHKH
ncbi:MAG: dephospho-CoA kinase [Prevotella sp.]